MSSGPDGPRPIQGSTAPGWYTAPDNPVMVRFWDGEMWTESLRPAPNSGVGTGNRVIKDHYVQTSAVVQAKLEGESIQAGFRGVVPSGRKTFAVATETRILFLFMRFIRSSKLKRVESIRYDDITAIGMTNSHTYGVGVAISSADQSFELFGSPALEGFVSYVETRLLGEDDQVDVRALPAPG